DNIARAEVNEIAVLLAALPGQAAAGQQAWRFTITNSLDRWASCEITTVEFRPRLNVRCGCLLSASSLGTSGVIADPTHVAQDLDYDFPPVEAGT
ncbi:MAG: hypothetical protein JNL32_03770, partial [Candidatus Kapabacteria bacterium]|nr:hypothetical protein [Candidatus Kapabacteria bacterium]